MAKDNLTQHQRDLVTQLTALARLTQIDFDQIRRYPRSRRTAMLKHMFREIVRGEVVGWYTVVDEALGSTLAEYFFGRTDFPTLWKTRRFQRFNYFVLERLYPLNKLDLVREVYRVPKKYAEAIGRLNDLRNAMAHSFFPENTRRFRPVEGSDRRHSTVTWRSGDLFTVDGLTLFVTEMEDLLAFLTRQLKRKRRARSAKAQVGRPGSQT